MNFLVICLEVNELSGSLGDLENFLYVLRDVLACVIEAGLYTKIAGQRTYGSN